MRLYVSRDGGTGFTDSPNKSKPAKEVSGRNAKGSVHPRAIEKWFAARRMNFAERGKEGCRNALSVPLNLSIASATSAISRAPSRQDLGSAVLLYRSEFLDCVAGAGSE